MGMLKQQDRTKVRELLDQALQRPVELVLITSRQDCDSCDIVREMLDEVVALNDRLKLTVLDDAADADRAAALGIDKTPAIAVLGGPAGIDYGVRFFGLPAGYEFMSLLEAISMVGSDDVELQPATREFLAGLATPLHLQVFVTPGCPYCPQAVILAHKLAYASPLITADMVEVSEFPELGERYEVMGVPRTVISDVTHVEGALPEAMLRARLEQAVEALAPAALSSPL